MNESLSQIIRTTKLSKEREGDRLRHFEYWVHLDMGSRHDVKSPSTLLGTTKFPNLESLFKAFLKHETEDK